MLPLTEHEIEQLSDLVMNRSLTKDEVRGIVKASRRNNGKSKALDNSRSSANSRYEEEVYFTDRAIRKAIASLKSTLLSFDDIAKEVDDQWLLRELITQYRQIIHGDIDTFFRLRKRLGKNPKLCMIANDTGVLHTPMNDDNKQNNPLHIFFAP